MTWLLVGIGLGVVASFVAVRWRVRTLIARRVSAERRARQAERLAEVGAMTSGLAHEIKNPLSTIGLNAQLLAEAIDELPEAEPVSADAKQRLGRRMGSLRREVERLRGILTDFLAYAGEMRLDLKPADLNRAVDELADFFLPQAQQQGVRLRTELEDGAVVAAIDTGHIKQAVLNLMLNGVQAVAGQDSATKAARQGELILRTRRARGAGGEAVAEVHVIDTGPGIAAEVRERLFQPYVTTKAGGTGLGLATTRRIIEAHGGRIEVHSVPGQGTDFVVVLPLVDNTRASEAGAARGGA